MYKPPHTELNSDCMGLFTMKEAQKNTLWVRGTMIPAVSYVWLLTDEKSGNVGRAFPNFI